MPDVLEEIEKKVIHIIHEEEETTYALVFLYVNKMGLEDFLEEDRKRVQTILERLMKDTDRHHKMLQSVLEIIHKEKEKEPQHD